MMKEIVKDSWCREMIGDWNTEAVSYYLRKENLKSTLLREHI